MCELSYSELRKGNLLYFPFISGNVEVIGVNALYGVNEPYFNKLSVIEGINMYYEPIDVFKPIIITGGLLRSMGFIESDHAGDCYSFGNLHIDLADFECAFKTNCLDCKTKYLHQLQNLYFALTNTELIWNGEK